MKVLIKIGGELASQKNHLDNLSLAVKKLINESVKVVVVHGGGNEISAALKADGQEVKFVNGLRYTSQDMMRVVEGVLSGNINKRIASNLNFSNIPAVGISGRDADTLKARRTDNKDLGYVGEIFETDNKLIHSLWQAGFLPVISPVSSDREGNSLNINADQAAASLAVSLKADTVFLVTSSGGIYDKNKNTIPLLKLSEIPLMIADGTISEGMIPKTVILKKMFNEGISKIFISEIPDDPISLIQGKSSIGTLITS